MKVHIVVTDAGGAVYEGNAQLVPSSGSLPRVPKQKAQVKTYDEVPALDCELPVRAFVKCHAKKLGGPKRFALLVARLCDGKVGAPVAVKDVEKCWSSMTEPMGGEYNSAYPSRARDDGWVEFPKKGSVVLRKGWKEILSAN